MRGFQPAAQRDAKTKESARAGMVSGPGTGISDDVQDSVDPGTYIMPADSTRQMGPGNLEAMGARGFSPGRRVPVNLSNGEFKLPPEQVHAIGVQALDGLKDATHTPVRGFAPGAQAMAAPDPRMFFADGGVVDDERRRQISPSNIYPQGSPSAGADIYGSVRRAVSDRLGSSGQFATVPPGIGQQPARTAPAAAPTVSLGSPERTAAERQARLGPNPSARGFAPGAAAFASTAPAPVPEPDEPRGFQPAAGGFGAPPADPAPSPAQAAGTPSARGFAPSATAAPQRGGSPAPAPAPVPATEVEGWRTKAVMDGAAEDAQQAWDRGNVAGAAGAVARGALTAIPTAVGEFAYNTAAPLIGAARGFGEGLFGTANAATEAPATAPAPAPITAGIAAAPAARGFSPEMAEQSRRNVTQQLPGAAATSAAAGTESRPGVFEHDRGQYSDQQSGMGFTRGFTGQPSPSANAAAEGLVRGFSPGMRSEPEASTVRGFAPGAFLAPVARHSGNDWQARNELRSAQVSASSITADGGRWDQHKGMSPEAATAAAMTNADLAARGAQPGMDTETMRQNAALTREGMQQAGETQRAGTRAAIEAQRTGIAAQQANTQRRSVDSQVEAQGYANRAAAQQEQLRGVLADPNASESAKIQAQKALRAMAGVRDAAKDRFLTVGGGQSVTKDGQTVKDPSQVYDTETGQWLQPPEQGVPQAPAVGAVQQGYRFKGGNPASSSSWERVG